MKLPDLSGRTAWLFGKGPGLEDYVAATVVHPRVDVRAVHVGINQVPVLIDCDYGFANDAQIVRQMRGLWPVDCQPVLPGNWESEYGPDRARDSEWSRVWWYEPTNIRVGSWDDDGYILGRGQTLNCPIGDSAIQGMTPGAFVKLRLVHYLGTALTALQWLRVCGCREVVLVGMEGRGGYARDWGNTAPGDGEVGAIRLGVLEYARLHGMRVRDWEMGKGKVTSCPDCYKGYLKYNHPPWMEKCKTCRGTGRKA